MNATNSPNDFRHRTWPPWVTCLLCLVGFLEMHGAVTLTELGVCNAGFEADAATAVAVSRGYAFVANSDGLHVLDVSDPRQPRSTGNILSYRHLACVVVEGDYVYVAYDGGVDVLNARDPLRPIWLGSYYTGYRSRYLRVQGHYAYLLGPLDSQELQVIDFSVPSAPVCVGSYSQTGVRWVNFVLERDHAYILTTPPVFLYCLSIAPPEVLMPQGSAPVKGNLGLCIVREFAYTSGGDPCDLGVYSVQRMEEVVRVRNLRVCALRLVAAGSVVVASSIHNAVHVLDARDPADPTVLCGILLSSIEYTHGFVVEGDLVYLAGEPGGLHILELDYPLALDPPRVETDGITLSWLGTDAPKLQATSSLENPHWEEVPADPAKRNSVTLPRSTVQAFFRLSSTPVP